MSFKSIFKIYLLTFSMGAFARPNTIIHDQKLQDRPASADELHNFAAASNCSAGYVDIGRSKGGKAVILTNGHCVSSSLVARQALINLPTSKHFSIFLANGTSINVTATRLLYATLMDTDIAFYELKETNAELESKGLVPFSLYQGRAPLGSAVRVTSGYWKETQECFLERRVFKLIEGFGSDISDPSIATNSFALSKECEIRGGYSGTPVLDESTNTVIAIAFTMSEGNQACAERSPCEEDFNGNRFYRKGVSYAARVDQIAGCVYGGEFNLALPTCKLYSTYN